MNILLEFFSFSIFSRLKLFYNLRKIASLRRDEFHFTNYVEKREREREKKISIPPVRAKFLTPRSVYRRPSAIFVAARTHVRAHTHIREARLVKRPARSKFFQTRKPHHHQDRTNIARYLQCTRTISLSLHPRFSLPTTHRSSVSPRFPLRRNARL